VLLVAENRRIERRLARFGTPPRLSPNPNIASSSMALGLLAARRRGLSHLLKQIPPMPLYWLLISAAAYRALWQFMTARFEWEKTERGLP
jgi:hypothetical protein